MPTPEKKAHPQPQTDLRQFAIELMPPANDPSLAHEVAELRKEIAALRTELTTSSSLILTGRQALDEFRKLGLYHA